MDNAFYFMQIMLLILLAVVGGLVLWLHFRFQRLKSAEGRFPLLSDTLSRNLQDVQQALGLLKKTSSAGLDGVEEKMKMAERLITDLDFMMNRADKMIKRLESAGQTPVTTSDKKVLSVEESGRENLVAAAASLERQALLGSFNVEDAQESVKKEKTNVYNMSRETNKVEAPQTLAEPETKQNETSQSLPKRMATVSYGLNAYGSTISRDENKPSEVEEGLRRVLEGRLS